MAKQKIVWVILSTNTKYGFSDLRELYLSSFQPIPARVQFF